MLSNSPLGGRDVLTEFTFTSSVLTTQKEQAWQNIYAFLR